MDGKRLIRFQSENAIFKFLQSRTSGLRSLLRMLACRSRPLGKGNEDAGYAEGQIHTLAIHDLARKILKGVDFKSEN